MHELPSLSLPRGAQGVVVSIWLAPAGLLCEVDFGWRATPSGAVRALLRPDQLEPVE
jgi:hypothetical protein